MEIDLDLGKIKKSWNEMSDLYYQNVNHNTMTIMAQLISLGRVRSAYKILDAGCGSGVSTKLLASQAPNKNSVIYAFDLSEKMVEYAKKEMKENDDFNENKANYWECVQYESDKKINIDEDIKDIRSNNKDGKIIKLFVGSAENLLFENNQLDLYISNLVLNSGADPNKILKEAHRVLKPGGIATFSIWGKKQETYYKRFFEENFESSGIKDTSNRDGPYKLGEDPVKLKLMIHSAGFEKVHLTYTQLTYDVYTVEDFFNKFKNNCINSVLEKENERKVEEYLSIVKEKIRRELLEPGNLPSLNVMLIVAFKSLKV